MPHSKDGEPAGHKVPTTPVVKRPVPEDGEPAGHKVPTTPVVKRPVPEDGEPAGHKVPTTPAVKRPVPPKTADLKKQAQSAKEDRGRRGRPGRGIDE